MGFYGIGIIWRAFFMGAGWERKRNRIWLRNAYEFGKTSERIKCDGGSWFGIKVGTWSSLSGGEKRAGWGRGRGLKNGRVIWFRARPQVGHWMLGFPDTEHIPYVSQFLANLWPLSKVMGSSIEPRWMNRGFYFRVHKRTKLLGDAFFDSFAYFSSALGRRKLTSQSSRDFVLYKKDHAEGRWHIRDNAHSSVYTKLDSLEKHILGRRIRIARYRNIFVKLATAA